MAKMKADSESETRSFEGSLTELEQVVRKLESGTQPLEQMLVDYAKAVELVQFCHTQLEGARRRVAQLEGVREDGHATVSAWQENATDASDGTEPPSRRRGK